MKRCVLVFSTLSLLLALFPLHAICDWTKGLGDAAMQGWMQGVQQQKERENYEQFQQSCKANIDMIYQVADKRGIKMPDYPKQPYSYEAINMLLDYLDREVKKQNQEIEAKMKLKEVDDICKGLMNKLQLQFKKDDPLKALGELEEDLYFKNGMKFLKETNVDAYKIMYKEFLNSISLAEALNDLKAPDSSKPASPPQTQSEPLKIPVKKH